LEKKAMTNNMLWMILAFTIGLGTGQLIGNSEATTETDEFPFTQKTDCTINGQIYNPCPTPTPTPQFAPGDQIQQQ
jgi:hypothetical protein